jgi:hypothetical protein
MSNNRTQATDKEGRSKEAMVKTHCIICFRALPFFYRPKLPITRDEPERFAEICDGCKGEIAAKIKR